MGDKVFLGMGTSKQLNSEFSFFPPRLTQKGNVLSNLPGFSQEDNNFLVIEVIMVVTHELFWY